MSCLAFPRRWPRRACFVLLASHTLAAQAIGDGASWWGVHGRVTDQDGSPIAFCQVSLMPRSGAESVGFCTLCPPLATARSGADGRFAIAVAQPLPPSGAELCVVAARCNEARKPISSAMGASYDIGDLALPAGCTVEGMVTADDELRTPVANAEIVLTGPGHGPGLSRTPGREVGILTHTDGLGCYRITGAPTGIVRVKAWARGLESKTNQIELAPGRPSPCDFTLAAADDVVGVVLDQDSRPVPGALVWTYSFDFGRVTRTGVDGRFVLPAGERSLLHVVAVGFAAAKTPFAATSPLHVVLQRLGVARVRAEGPSGQPLTEFVVQVQACTDNRWDCVMPPRIVHVGADGRALVPGLPPGRCRLRVEAPELAPEFSAPFAFVSGEPEITVRLDEGGAIEGRVRDEDGRPLAGATITTLPDHEDAHPIRRMFPHYQPCADVTRTTVVTDHNGQFRSVRLRPGTYYLRASHPDRCDARLDAIAVHAHAVARAPDITIVTGALVSGNVRCEEPIRGPYAVSLHAVGVPGPFVWSDLVVTDDNGRFVLHDRVPPGRHRLVVSRAADTPVPRSERVADQTIEITGTDRVRHIDVTEAATR